MKQKLLLLLSLLPFISLAQFATEGFESSWPASGWTTANLAGLNEQWHQSPANSTIYPAYMGSHCAVIEGEDVAAGTSAEDWLITPAINIPVGGAALSFYSRLNTVGNDATYKVLIGSSPDDYATFVELESWNATELNPAFDTYTQKIIEFPAAYAGQTRYIAFVSQGDEAHAWMVDEVGMQAFCPAPTGLTVSNISLTGATVSWTETGFSTSWEVLIVPAGEPVGNNAGTITTVNPYVITNLMPGNCYDVYVKSACDPLSQSLWSAPFQFCIGESFAAINGTVHYDSNGDGNCDSTDIALPNTEIQISINGVAAGSVYTNALGDYNYYVNEPDTYNITFTPVAPAGFTAPAAATQTITVTAGASTIQGPDFCFEQPSTPVNNLAITTIPAAQIVPGFESTFNLQVQNVGSTTATNVEATFSFDSSRFQVVAVDGVAATQTGPVNFAFAQITPFTTVNHTITLLANTPPVNNSGNAVTFTSALNYIDDNALDNTSTVQKIFVNSFDPNDITVHEGAEITPEQAEGYLTYTIRFENTGTAPAQKVKLLQQLSDNLDWNTFTPVQASHNYDLQRNGSDISVTFNNINLPFTTEENPTAGQGFITYRIKPQATVAIGDFIYGTAEIYFDFNEAIVTNTCSTEVVNETSGTENFAATTVKIFPNPANAVVNISVSEVQLLSTAVYDINGRLRLKSDNDTIINISALSPGIYMLKVNTDKGSSNYKLIKE